MACVFCEILAGVEPARIIAEEARAVAFMDIQPATPGHLLVVPRAHAESFLDAPEPDLAACMILVRRMGRLLRERLHTAGVNVLTSAGRDAWQTVFHLHLHVIPRYVDDTLELPWTPTPGDPARIAEVAVRLTG